MALTRKFIDWSLPPLESAVKFLASRYQKADQLDLSDVILVLSGRRGCRQLLKQLAIYAEQQQTILQLPEIVTSGLFPELLYTARRPFATDLTQRFAWAAALKNLRRSGGEYFTPPTNENEISGWLDLANLFFRTHREVAGDGMDFRDVILAAQKIPGFGELPRWKFFRRVQQKYLDILDQQNVWDRQTARRTAIEKGECKCDRDIVLVGTVDLSRSIVQMLETVRDRVTAVVFAPEDLAERFDHFGCLQTNHWENSRTNIDDAQISLVEGPEDQATRLIELLEQHRDAAAEDFSIGIGDPTIVRSLENTMRQVGVSGHWSGGHRIAETQPYQLVRAVAGYIEGQRFFDFAALVRHPAMTRWIDREVFSIDPADAESKTLDWLTQLDEYFQNHLQPKLGFWLGPRSRNAEIRKIHASIDQIMAPLFRPKSRKLDAWASLIAQVLTEFYRGTDLDSDDPEQQKMIAALEQIRLALFEIQAIPESIAPNVSSSEALQLLLAELQEKSIPVAASDRAIELLGWLELPLDNAPVTIVTSMNDEMIPQSQNADVMLPNTLRSKLGLTDNSRRYGRDNYFLNVLAASRKNLHLLVAKRNREGDPLTPSRLLFASDRKRLTDRALKLFGPGAHLELQLGESLRSASTDENLSGNGNQRQPIQVPKPLRQPKPLASVSVTAFRSYIACPYYFYLKHVEKLDPIDDQIHELSPPSFGNAIHDVLETFGQSELRTSINADEIREFLREQMDEYFLRMFGKHPLPAVEIQKSQSQQRLNVFADWQADWAAQGWQIQHTELDAEGVKLATDDGRQLELRGRIDRVDYHPELKCSAILDYKTGDRDTSPKKKHRDGDGNWIDLQLPLYRLIAQHMKIPGPYRFGYISLPKDLSLLGAYFADWSDQELDEAVVNARQIVKKILDQEFWPMADQHRYRRDFAAICQDQVLNRRVETATTGIEHQP